MGGREPRNKHGRGGGKKDGKKGEDLQTRSTLKAGFQSPPVHFFSCLGGAGDAVCCMSYMSPAGWRRRCVVKQL